jgi:hypothetical protein
MRALLEWTSPEIIFFRRSLKKLRRGRRTMQVGEVGKSTTTTPTEFLLKLCIRWKRYAVIDVYGIAA